MGVLGLIEVPKQIEKDVQFFRNNIKPSVEFVKYFKQNHHRLPSDSEFDTWLIKSGRSELALPVDYIRNPTNIFHSDLSRFTKADWRKDFAISVWRGEWMEYYFSWTDSYDVNSYSWKDGWSDFAFCACLGVLPLMILHFFRRKERRKLIITHP